MANIQPNQIHGYPQGGELKYLFRKRLTQTDIKANLVLVGDSSDYFCALPKPKLDSISQGLDIDLYTPEGIFYASITCRSRPGASFTLRKNGWYDAALDNGFRVGADIDFWVLYPANEGAGGTLSILIQKVVNQAQEAAEGEEGGN